jgi:Mg-chelatase subunit ChlI
LFAADSWAIFRKTMTDFQEQIEAFQADAAKIVEQIGRVIVGHEEVVEQVLTCLLSGGHVLLEGVPGIGKTLLVRTLAAALDLSFPGISRASSSRPISCRPTSPARTFSRPTPPGPSDSPSSPARSSPT